MAETDRDQARAILRQSSWLGGAVEALVGPLLTHGRLMRLSDGEWAQAGGGDETRLGLLGLAAGGGPTVRLPQQTLAEMLGLTRKTVNGYLGEFEAAGLIRRGYGEIAILDQAGLRRIAER